MYLWGVLSGFFTAAVMVAGLFMYKVHYRLIRLGGIYHRPGMGKGTFSCYDIENAVIGGKLHLRVYMVEAPIDGSLPTDPDLNEPSQHKRTWTYKNASSTEEVEAPR